MMRRVVVDVVEVDVVDPGFVVDVEVVGGSTAGGGRSLTKPSLAGGAVGNWRTPGSYPVGGTHPRPRDSTAPCDSYDSGETHVMRGGLSNRCEDVLPSWGLSKRLVARRTAARAVDAAPGDLP